MLLSIEDIKKLKSEPSSQARADIASKLAAAFNAKGLNETESAVAHDIFRMLMHDAAVLVRKTLSESLCHSHNLPHDIALKLAQDITDVALPMLEHSYALSEEDLVEIVQLTKVVAKQVAVSRRETLSRPLVSTLLETGHTQVVETVLKNNGASLSEETVASFFDGWSKQPELMEALAMRNDLSSRFAEQLFNFVPEPTQLHLSQTYRLKMRPAIEPATSEESEDIHLSPSHEASQQLADSLNLSGSLEPSMILRSLCEGNVRFFESALAMRARIPTTSARLLLLDPGPLGFKAICQAAGMPEDFLEALHVFYHLANDETHYGQITREDFQQRMIRRIVAEGYDRKIEQLAYLISIMGKRVPDVAHAA